jgi:sarcosine oxidase gamma subunit
MADTNDPLCAIEASGVRVALDSSIHVASLRSFDRNGVLSDTVQSLLGMPVPGRLCATRASQRTEANTAILAWRGPTETLLLCGDSLLVKQLREEVSGLSNCCVVDQTGGALALRITGKAAAEVFSRIGGEGSMPMLGESRRSRLAEVPVLAMQVEPGEFILVVERVYAEHVMAWIRGIAADL